MAADHGCKVGTTIAAYGLDSADPVYESIDEGLLARWKGTGGQSAMGYRSLTDWFNKRLLNQVYGEHNRETLGARLDSDYSTLRGDDDLVKAELIESLRADGIDGSRLEQSMVSWGTMRTHLQECLDGHKEPQSASTDWERESIEKAKEVANEKTAKALSSLSKKGELAGGADSDVTVQIQLTCDSCPTRVPFDVALERGYVCERHSQSPTSSNES
ncbi:rod-determining factor RdfA [Halosimplex sp. J119]